MLRISQKLTEPSGKVSCKARNEYQTKNPPGLFTSSVQSANNRIYADGRQDGYFEGDREKHIHSLYILFL